MLDVRSHNPVSQAPEKTKTKDNNKNIKETSDMIKTFDRAISLCCVPNTIDIDFVVVNIASIGPGLAVVSVVYIYAILWFPFSSSGMKGESVFCWHCKRDWN